MTIQQPTPTSLQNNPDHALSHRVFANDDSAPDEAVVVDANGHVGIGEVAPTAILHLKAGTASANTAPLKFTAGTLLTSVEPGAMEYKGHTLYFTTYLVRRSVVLAQEVPIAPVTVGPSDSSETTIYSIPMAANYLTVGKQINMSMNGVYSSRNNPNAIFTVRLKYAGATIFAQSNNPGNASAVPFEISFRTICRAIGSGTSGKLKTFGNFNINNSSPILLMGALTDIDTTVANTIDVTIQWGEVHASNSFTMEMAETVCVDANT